MVSDAILRAFPVSTVRHMLQKRIDDQPSISRESMREAEAIFLRHLRRVGLKQTGQRNTILRTFLETREHLSTDELHRLVKKKDPAHRIHHRLSHAQTPRRMRPGQRSRLPRWHRPLRAPIQPPQPSPHGVYRVRRVGRIFFARGRRDRAGDRPQTPIPDDSPHFSDLRRLRGVQRG